jgi:FdhD protein
VVEEVALTLYHNGQEMVTILCSPGDEEYLVMGFLLAEGLITSQAEVSLLKIDLDEGLVWIETTNKDHQIKPFKRCLSACCGKGRVGFYFANDARVVNKVEGKVQLTIPAVYAYVRQFDQVSELFRLTGGVHGGALAEDGHFSCHFQDIGRHNVLDKLYGYCFVNQITTQDKVLVFSGRVSSEIVLKVSKMKIPVIIARSAPTRLALGLADELGITVIGFARENRFNVYTHPQRVVMSRP